MSSHKDVSTPTPNYIPYLFTKPMVRAILEGRKWMTRRIVKTPAAWLRKKWVSGELHKFAYDCQLDVNGDIYFLVAADQGFIGPLPCPYGKPGDLLYAKETFYAYGRWETRFSDKKGRDEWRFIDLTLECGRQYQYDAPDGYAKTERSGITPTWWKRPAIFMPRTASRIVRPIQAIRGERLQDISEEDAMAEGITEPQPVHGKWCDPAKGREGHWSYRKPFSELWDSVNGKRASWESNPWVRVIEFQKEQA